MSTVIIDDDDPRVQFVNSDRDWFHRTCSDNVANIRVNPDCHQPNSRGSQVRLIFEGIGAEILGFTFQGAPTNDLLHCTVDNSSNYSSFNPGANQTATFCSVMGLPNAQHTLTATAGQWFFNILIDKFRIVTPDRPTRKSPASAAASVIVNKPMSSSPHHPDDTATASITEVITSISPAPFILSEPTSNTPHPSSSSNTGAATTIPIGAAPVSTDATTFSTGATTGSTGSTVLATTSSTARGSDNRDDGGHIKTGVVVGGIVGGVLLTLLATMVLCRRRLLSMRNADTQQQESTSHDSDSSDVNSLAGSHSSDGHGPFESHEGKMGSVHLDNTPVMQSSPTRMMLGLSEVTGQSSAQSSYRSEWPISSQHPGDPKLAHEADTPPLLNVRVDSTPVPPEPHVLNPEVAQLPWRAPLQLHERGQCLLQALSERHEGARGRPAQDVDSGLRLYEEDVLPPPYSAE